MRRQLVCIGVVFSLGCSGPPTALELDAGLAVDAGEVGVGEGDAGAPDAGRLVWPNALSSTNSDEWLAVHHDELTQLQPRVLVVNFVAGRDAGEVMQKIRAVGAALGEGSRYHGYDDAGAPVFLEYVFTHFVDLGGQPTRTSDGGSFGYDEFLRSQSFADKVGYADPADGGRNLTVCELFERGLINEAWVAEPALDPAKLFETKSRAQKYDTAFRKLPGQFNRCSGNGCMPDVACGVTVRLAEINLDRGPGCMTHAAAHSLEGLTNSKNIPWFSANASRFFMLDFKTRYGTSFDSFYVCPYGGPCIERPTPDHALSAADAGVTFDLQPIGPGCGNAHFAPNSRAQYDYESSSAGLFGRATCRGYGLGAGAGGADMTDDIDYAVYAALNQNRAYSDCGGGWQIYLRQSMPGLGNAARDTTGQPMKNWWPFLFY